VAHLEFWLLAGALAALIPGLWGLVWTRTSRRPERHGWGRKLFVGTLVILGAGSLLAAFYRANGLVPLGLSAGFLVVAMFIESPRSAGPGMATTEP
jgi:hypothetical protein